MELALRLVPQAVMVKPVGGLTSTRHAGRTSPWTQFTAFGQFAGCDVGGEETLPKRGVATRGVRRLRRVWQGAG